MRSSKRGFLFILVLNLFVLCIKANNGLVDYKKISANGKFGLADAATNTTIIEPIFDNIGWSNGGLQVIDGVIGFKENETWGLIELSGNKVVNAQFTSLKPFTKNFLIVGKRNRFSILNKYGIINTKGKTIVKLENERISAVGTNAIVTRLTKGASKVGLISSTGKTIIPFDYESITSIDEELLAVEDKTGLKAIFNKAGKKQSSFDFESIEPLGDSHLLITFFNRKGIVDRSGKVIAQPIYRQIENDRGAFTGETFDKWTLLNDQNQIINSFYFDKILPVTPNRFAIQTGDNFGIVSEEEDYIGYLIDTKLQITQHGLTVVRSGAYHGLLDANAKLILPVQQDSIWLTAKAAFAKISRADGQSWTPFDHYGDKKGYFQYETFERENTERIRAKRNGKWGLLDNHSNEVSPFLYDSLSQLKGQFAKVFYQGRYGVINENGIWVVTPYRDQISLHEKNFLYQQGSENGIMNLEGKILYRTQNDITPLGGLFVEKTREGQYLLLNSEGSREHLQAVDSVFHIEPSLYLIRKQERWHILNSIAKITIPLSPDIQQIKGYDEDVISVLIDDQWGYIDEQGNLNVANRYDSVQHFSEGLSAVKLIGKWGFIDRQEKLVIQPTYDEVEPFFGRLSVVKKDNLFGLIKFNGEIILDLKYDKIERFDNHIALHSKGLIGLANQQGVVLREPQFTAIKAINKTRFMVSKDGKYGVVTIKGLDLIPMAYKEIIAFGNRFLVREKPERKEIKLN